MPRIAIAGIHIESSAYAAHRAGYRDFTVLTGDELVERYAFLGGTELAARAEWHGAFYARSIPGGAVEASVYADFRSRIVESLAALAADEPLDGLYLDIHGAMSVEGMDDSEGDLIVAIREAIGDDVVISASMDLHGNVSRPLIENVDLITCFRMAPHEDACETRERAVRNLVEHLEAPQPFVKAWVPIPILLPGEKTSTRVEPARGLYGRIPSIEAMRGIIDAAIWIGYAWADEPRCHATVVVTGTDEQLASDQAERLAREFWQVRDRFEFVGPPGTLAEAIERGLGAERRPYLISDSGDNPGAGGSGDVTWTLTELLRMPALTSDDSRTVLCASVFDTETVRSVAGVQPGEELSIEVGARVDDRVSGPVVVTGTLLSRTTDDVDAGTILVIGRGSLRIIVTEYRKAFHRVSDFTAIGLDPASADIVITKIGYLEPELYDIAEGWTLALTPGPVDQDLERLGHRRIKRPMFPFDDFDTEPSFRPELVR